MSVRLVEVSEARPRAAAPGVDDLRRARDDAAELCAWTTTSIPSPAGEVLVLRLAGEIDLFTAAVLQAALTDAIAREPRHLLVDLAELSFCDVRGLTLLVQAARSAARQGTGYAVSGGSPQINRAWSILWPDIELPIRYPTVAAGVVAAMAGRPTGRRAGSASTSDRTHRSDRQNPSNPTESHQPENQS